MKKKKNYIVHRWGGSPDEPMYKWLKAELKKNGYEVIVPEMPDSETPHIGAWVSKLEEIAGEPDEETIFVGHSIGCQAILRYLAGLDGNKRVGGVVFIAPWTKLNMEMIEEEGRESVAIAEEWTETPLDFGGAKKHIKGKIAAIFSDNDPFVPISEKEIFAEKLGTEIIVEHGKGHFTADDGVEKLESALNAILEIK